MEYREAIIQEAEQIFKTKFWSLVQSKLREKRGHVATRFNDDPIFTQEGWMKHLWWQGQQKGLDTAIGIPEQILEELKKGDLAKAKP